ncbi:MAG: hypothetical protein SVU32_02985 [Candidatus Nanohaloarchaea archaeon]|nr:hypothetical protein [Candidatus Nanohaloarchaea archaeon]
MSSEVFDVEAASVLEDPDRYRYLSRDELVQAIDPREQAAVLEGCPQMLSW